MGDSLTSGLGVEQREAYPAVLEKRLMARGFSYEVINAGVSGDTTAGGLRRVSWVLKSRPNLVILELGGNDGLRGLGLHQTEENLSKIIEQLLKAGTKVVLAGMRLPTNYGKQYTDEFAAIFPRLAARYHLVLIPFFLEGVAADAGLNQADGIHPTARGYEVIVDHLLPIIEPLLSKK
ncbi:MAG TPA: arylesterase [Nitrospiria bacterium]|nr:arylesterase [Nitrospiria bacterium]